MPAHLAISADRSTERLSRAARIIAPLASIAIAIVLAAGCSSDGSSGGSGSSESGSSDEFCAAVRSYAEAKADGDTAGMAEALEIDTSDLPTEAAEDLEAYIANLQAPPPNQPNEPDAVEDDSAQASFEEFADERCGAGTTGPDRGTATTTSTTASTTTAPDLTPRTSTAPNVNTERQGDDGSTGYTDGGADTEDDDDPVGG